MSFRKELEIFGEVSDFVKSERDKLAIRIDTRLAIETPVDEGTARLNWRVGFNESVAGTLPPPPEPLMASKISMVVAQKEIKKAPPFGLLYIQNNLPYIEPLNEGSSIQAESKFVDVIIEQEVARGS